MNSSKAETLFDQGVARWEDLTRWAVANSLDLALALGAAALVVILLLAVKRFGHRLIRDTDAAMSWRTIIGRALSRTSLFFIITAAIKLVSTQAEAPPFASGAINIAFTVAAALQAAIWGRELVLGFIQHRIGEEETGRLSSALGIIRLFITVTLFAIAFIVILDNLGVNVTGLVAGLGIGGIAIGLAAQGIFSDLFAALSIIFDRPFRRGDSITFGTTTGTVEQIGLKTTRVRSTTGEEVVISNAKLLEQQLQNWTMLQRRRVVMQLGVIYQIPVEMLERIPGELQAIVEARPDCTFDRAHAWQFGASSIDIEFVFHVESSDYAVYMQARHAIMLAIMRRFAELEIEFAYPTQTTFTAAPDGRMVMPYASSVEVKTPG